MISVIASLTMVSCVAPLIGENCANPLSQVHALNVDVPLLSRDAGTGKFRLTMGVKKTTTLAQPARLRVGDDASTFALRQRKCRYLKTLTHLR